MRKIASNIFVVLFILCFVSQKSYAKCGKFDFYCKRMLNDNPGLAKSLLPKIKIKTGCKKHDYYCKRISRKNWLQYVNQNKSLLGSS